VIFKLKESLLKLIPIQTLHDAKPKLLRLSSIEVIQTSIQSALLQRKTLMQTKFKALMNFVLILIISPMKVSLTSLMNRTNTWPKLFRWTSIPSWLQPLQKKMS